MAGTSPERSFLISVAVSALVRGIRLALLGIIGGGSWV
jgi:hypothetical protein